MNQQTTENPDVPWGGKRYGAGRKSAPTGKRESISTRVDAETSRKLREEAERQGVGVGNVIDQLVKKVLK
jgi:hypothetical protein